MIWWRAGWRSGKEQIREKILEKEGVKLRMEGVAVEQDKCKKKRLQIQMDGEDLKKKIESNDVIE